MKIRPIILCGGEGTRLWPKSKNNQAKQFMDDHTTTASTWDEFKENINNGFVICGWDGSEETEMKIKVETKATIRCIPSNQNIKNLKCIYSGNNAKYLSVFAKAY